MSEMTAEEVENEAMEQLAKEQHQNKLDCIKDWLRKVQHLEQELITARSELFEVCKKPESDFRTSMNYCFKP